MKTEEFLYCDKETGIDVKVVVTGATVLVGMKRSRLRREGIDSGETDIDRRLLRVFTFPDIMAATVSITGSGLPDPLDFDAFVLLPDIFVSRWEGVVYRLNPHWLPSSAEEEDDDGPKSSAPTSIDD